LGSPGLLNNNTSKKSMSGNSFPNFSAPPPFSASFREFGERVACHRLFCFNAAMQDLLKQVSRSFYLTLRILPRSIKSQLSLAYLLARATDTVADTQLIPAGRRREMLLRLRTSIREACEGRRIALPDFGDFAEAQKAASEPGSIAESALAESALAERTLLENVGELLKALSEFSEGDRLMIRSVLDTIIQGQEKDLVRFGAGADNEIFALHTDEELDGYTYNVAGCVGEFWTRICRAHVFPEAALNDDILLTNAVRFGKGLQLVNILRDLPKDLRQRRCYIPNDQLSRHGLKPRDLLSADSIDRFRPLYQYYLQQAEDHLLAGWQYTAMLPFGCVRIRLACAWPILIGARTIALLRTGNILDDRHRIKLSRSNIRRLILRSIIYYPNRKLWERLFHVL
jgi:farnesyl-diphosphate farnesyltransferase